MRLSMRSAIELGTRVRGSGLHEMEGNSAVFLGIQRRCRCLLRGKSWIRPRKTSDNRAFRARCQSCTRMAATVQERHGLSMMAADVPLTGASHFPTSSRRPVLDEAHFLGKPPRKVGSAHAATVSEVLSFLLHLQVMPARTSQTPCPSGLGSQIDFSLGNFAHLS